MTIYPLELTNDAQTFSVIFSGTTYVLTIQYNEFQGWQMNVADINGNSIVNNIPFTTGTDLLLPYGYLNFGGSLFAVTDGNDLPPTFDNLGINSNLYFVVS